jgi:hypothetical protein
VKCARPRPPGSRWWAGKVHDCCAALRATSLAAVRAEDDSQGLTGLGLNPAQRACVSCLSLLR